MPLLHRKPFVRQKPPADLRPDEEVFLCKITHEIFRTYDEFFERTILCNSLVWSCSLTGRPGLTYLEAVDSERRARQNLQSFPSALVLPLLHLASLTQRCRLSELCEDVYDFARQRFFPGETVDVAGRNGARCLCEILEVQSPSSCCNGQARSTTVANGNGKQPPDGDTIVISDSDDEGASKPQVNGVKRKSLTPGVFKYKVKLVKTDDSPPFLAKANQINRKKNGLSRERLKLLLKQYCEPHDGFIRLKPSTVSKFGLSEQTFSQFFPDEPPHFPSSVPAKPRGRPPGLTSPGQEKRDDTMPSANERDKMRREKEDLQEARRREREDKERQREEFRRRFEEEKQKRKEEKEKMKLEKEMEREKLKEEKKRYAERMKLWNKPREDMECEDLKELPSPVPVHTRVPAELFGDVLMVLEFLGAFGEFFDLKDEFPDGVSLEVVEEALVASDPEGPLCELLFFFLSAIFQAQTEEQEEALAEGVSEARDDETDRDHLAISAVASLTAAWSQLHQGCHIKKLDLDSCTLSEILRLHILSSGADCTHGNAKFRYQKQGGFMSTDDPCVELRLANPALLKRLARTSVYDLTPGEKLSILQVLCGKLLSLVSTRDFIEDNADDQKFGKQELRETRAEQHRRDREEAAYRVRVRKEEKLKEQELRMKELEEKLKEDRNGTAHRESLTGQNTEDEEDDASNKKTVGFNQKEKHKMLSSSTAAPVSLTAEELEEEQQKVQELQDRIQKASCRTAIIPLGRDRLYRRYWLFPSTCALFVEDDAFGLTEDMLEPHPAPPSQDGETEDGAQQDTPMDTHSPAPIVASGPPVIRPNQWAFYSSVEEVEQLMEALNPRGNRESGLKEALQQEKDRIAHILNNNTAADKYNYTDKPESSSRSVPESSAPAESFMENRLRDMLLDIEDRIYQGSLGVLKSMQRETWRAALEKGQYDLLVADGRQNGEMNGGEEMEVDSSHLHISTKDRSSLSGSCSVQLFRLQELRGEVAGSTGTGSGGTGTPQPVNSTVRCLAHALAQIEQGIERKFLKAPLGDDESKKDQKNKKNRKKDDDQSSEDGSDSGRVCKTILERWRDSLQSCSSLSQVFVHLSTLDRSIIWAKSLLNTRCKLCRRKGDAENMLLCDGCDRGHHLHCLRPRLKSVPEGDWFCPDCRPKQRSVRLPSRQRSSIDEEEEDDDEEEESEEEEEEEEEDSDEEESSAEEQEPVSKKVSAAVKLPPSSKGSAVKLPPSTKGSKSAKQGGSNQSTPKGQQVSSRNGSSAGKNSSASKSSAKKATPSSSKGTPVSNGRAPPRAGVRTSSRLSTEILAAPTSKPSSAQKRTATDVSPSSKPSKPVLLSSTSSSSRRSSGRNHGVHELSACEQLTVELVRQPDSWPFIKLVSKTQVPDYYDIIKTPIALSTIRERLNNCEYKTSAEYIEDMGLMFSNCFQYNPRHTNEAKAGQRLQSFFQSELTKLGLSQDNTPPPKRSRT